MIVQKFICDICSNEITTEHINRISIEKANKLALDDLGDFDSDLADAHFCDGCISKIKEFITSGICGLPFVEPKEPAKAPDLEENEEVIQENVPKERKPRLKGEELEQAKQRARELYELGDGPAEIARKLGLRYTTVVRWL